MREMQKNVLSAHTYFAPIDQQAFPLRSICCYQVPNLPTRLVNRHIKILFFKLFVTDDNYILLSLF